MSIGKVLGGLAGWIRDNTVVGPAEPIDDMRSDESQSEYLRRKHNADMGANYGPHDDLQEQAYTKDRHGNLKPYNP